MPGLRVGITIIEKGSTLPAGVHRYAANVIRALLHRSDVGKVIVFSHGNDLVYEYLEPDEQRRVEKIAYNPIVDNAASAIAWHVATLPWLARKHRLDIVHISNGRVFGPRLGIPYVVTLHDLAELEITAKYGSIRSAYRRRVQYPFMRRQSLLLTVSRSAMLDIARHLDRPESSIRVVPNYAVRRNFEPATASGPFILYVGRIDHPSKNLVMLIRAFDAAATTLPGLRLRFAGSDSWGAQTVHREAERAEHAEQIDFLGWVSDGELGGLMSAAGVLCLPSLHEGFGLPLAEALAFGTPVLAADAGSLPEVLGTRDGLLPASDEKAWTAAILALMSSRADRDSLLQEQLRGQEYVGEGAMAIVSQALMNAYAQAVALAEAGTPPQ